MVNKIKDIEMFTTMTKGVKKKVGRTTSNCFMMPNEINWYIAENRMQYVELDAGIVILCDEVNFYHLYYYASPEIPLSEIKVDKPVIINFVEHELRRDPRVRKMKENFEKIWFTPYSTTRRMLRATTDTDVEAIQAAFHGINEKGMAIKFAEIKDVKQIMDIWHDSLDVLLHPLFEEKYIINQIKEKEIICVSNEQDEVLGALQYKQTGNSLMLWYVAVDSRLRNMGGGQAMTYKMIEISLNNGARNTSVWVVEDNFGAIRFYKKIGYEFDGMCSQRYLLR